MSRSSCVIKEVPGGTLHEYTPIGVKFKAEGSKKPDVLVSHFTINNKVRENYEIAYIQDIISVEYLACIHNFQLSALDDRGYDLDGESGASVNIAESRFFDVDVGRFKGNYALDFNATNQAIIIPNAKAVTRVDLSGQFDIYVFFFPANNQFIDGNNEPIVWSFNDGSSGLEIGITNAANVNEWKGFFRAGNGITNVVQNTNIIIPLGDISKPTLIRVFRGGDNIVRMEVNGELDGDPLLKTGSMNPSGVDLIFGNGNGNNDDFRGLIHQERTYIGTVLTQVQADAIRQSRPALFTMKFAGNIWNVDDKESYKIVKADSFSKSFVNTKFPLTTSPTTYNLPTIPFKTIMQGLVDEATSPNQFLVKAKDTFATTVTLFGNLIQVGSFLDVSSILFLFSGTTFYITPRKLLIVETSSGHLTDFIFDQDKDTTNTPYDITESVDNNTNLVTSVILTSPNPLINTEDSLSSPAGATFTLRKQVAQIDQQTDLGNLAIKIRESFQSINTRFVIKINTLVNWVRFNHIVTINNSRKNINNAPFIISQIEHEYPRSDTKIAVNENEIDFFDITNNNSLVQQTLLDGTDT